MIYVLASFECSRKNSDAICSSNMLQNFVIACKFKYLYHFLSASFLTSPNNKYLRIIVEKVQDSLDISASGKQELLFTDCH